MGGLIALRDIALQEIAPPPLGSPASTDDEDDEEVAAAPARMPSPGDIRQHT
jgi:hypothetical protein